MVKMFSQSVLFNLSNEKERMGKYNEGDTNEKEGI